ncbi:MAG: PEP-CTERM sorting domain-containing protein [Cyanobacteria bacterium P01_G01_bin.38]
MITVLVRFDVTLAEPFELPADRYFFVPQVGVESGEFLWASAARPIVAPGTPLDPDLQTWIRDENLDPDWLRIGTDVIGEGAFNASFSVAGQTAVPEPSLVLALAGVAFAGGCFLRDRKSA